MKKILITGKDSYIGTSFEKWLKQWPGQYEVDTVGTKNDEWRSFDFSGYDTVLHVAGIAHVSVNPKMKDLYYRVNRDLAIDVAQKAKKVGVKQFVFMSSIIVYGEDAPIGAKMMITKDTVPQPSNFYGKSKLASDLAIQKMNDVQFHTVVIRSPMVYGPGCKGNFPKLIKFAKLCPVFPDINNERSMIFIDNLSEFIRLCIDWDVSGVFYPQNRDYLSTKVIIAILAEQMCKKVWFISHFNILFRLVSKKIGLINKVFGSKVYDATLSDIFHWDYCVIATTESIKKSV
jgi:nucleoside-diphosphate-sugar epimerase